MRKTVLLILPVLLILLIISLFQKDTETENTKAQTDSNHLYASWDTMEYDKCVAIWMIQRFVDAEAQFVFHPAETQIQEGVIFDVPGAAWSRQHRKCTSDCILETLTVDDPVLEAIVAMAHNIELNFWKLDSFPQAQQSFQEVMAILNEEGNNEDSITAIVTYFDQMYLSLKDKENE